jgi:hypothetical protein
MSPSSVQVAPVPFSLGGFAMGANRGPPAWRGEWLGVSNALPVLQPLFQKKKTLALPYP